MAPKNAISTIKSEITQILTAMKWDSRVGSRTANDEAYKTLFKALSQLRSILNNISNLNEIEPLVYLTPFLNVVKSESTSGYITDLALTSVDKFLSYGLIDPSSATDSSSLAAIASAADAIACAVTRTNFSGSSRQADEVVLMKILHLLRSLLLLPVGTLVTNDSIAKILQVCPHPTASKSIRVSRGHCWSRQAPAMTVCFQLCFEAKVTELLRKTSESVLASLIQLFFFRLPSLKPLHQAQAPEEADAKSQVPVNLRKSISSNDDDAVLVEASDYLPASDTGQELPGLGVDSSKHSYMSPEEASRPQAAAVQQATPYDLLAVYRLFDYLITCLDAETSTDNVILTALNLITVALETGADAVARSPFLMDLVKARLSKFLVFLLSTERAGTLTAVCRTAFLLFESIRTQLKLQLEAFLRRLVELVSHDNVKTPPELKEIGLDALIQLFALPCFPVELYLNYDCDAYAVSLFDLVAETLSKNSHTGAARGGHFTLSADSYQMLSLDALLLVMDSIEVNCLSQDEAASSMLVEEESLRKRLVNRHHTDASLIPSSVELAKQRHRKRVLLRGTHKFNSCPKTGIAYLQKHRILQDPIDPDELAQFLISNPQLDKKIIGDYLSNRKNTTVLAQFVKKLNFSGMRIDQALRLYVEAFRLPGEAPLIQHLMEHFAEQWSIANEMPFANVDAAFTLSYAILMLNTDQHNPNSKKQNVPMNLAAFQRNLTGMNGGADFDQELLAGIFREIRDNEIVMPSEQTGLVKENYLWKCLLNRSQQTSLVYLHLQPGHFDAEIFAALCGPLLLALVRVFDRAGPTDALGQLRAITGFIQCARMASYYGMSDVLDTVVLEMCRFTGLLPSDKLLRTADATIDQLAVSFGRSAKSRLAASLAFALVAHHGDQVRDGWRALLECILQMFRASLLPRSLVQTEDFTQQDRIVRITPKGPMRSSNAGSENSKVENSVLGSFYQFFYSPAPNPDPEPSAEKLDGNEGGDADHVLTSRQMSVQINNRKLLTNAVIDSIALAQAANSYNDAMAKQSALKSVADLQIGQVLADSKFLVDDSIEALTQALLSYIQDDQLSLGGSLARDLVDTHLEALWTGLSSADASERHNLLQDVNFYHTLMLDAVAPHREVTAHSHVEGMALSTSTPNLDLISDLKSARQEEEEPHLSGAHATLPVSAECRVFCLELLMRVLLTNRDRVHSLWSKVRIRLAEVILCSDTPTFMVERVCVGLLRLAVRMLRKQEMTLQMLLFLHTLLVLRAPQLLVPPHSALHPFTQRKSIQHKIQQARNSGAERQALAAAVRYLRSLQSVHETSIAQQVVRGLGDLMHTHAADLASPLEWHLVFNLISIAGASLRVVPSKDLIQLSWKAPDEPHLPTVPSVVAGEECSEGKPVTSILLRFLPKNLALPVEIGLRDPVALEKACENLNFLIRDPAYLMPDNYESCVYCLRVFVEACLCKRADQQLQRKLTMELLTLNHRSMSSDRIAVTSPDGSPANSASPVTSPKHQSNQTSNDLLNTFLMPEGGVDVLSSEVALQEQNSTNQVTGNLSLQLLDLIHTLFMRTTSIYIEWNREQMQARGELGPGAQVPEPDIEILWNRCWLPLLKATARLAMDTRKEVRAEALSFLQRQLHSQILQPLAGHHWIFCFEQILFPLLASYLESIAQEETEDSRDTAELTDPRMRAIPFITKVFLQHLTALHQTPHFLSTWSHLLTFMEHFITASSCDSLNDAVRESLKNVLLVMYTSAILVRDQGDIWHTTKQQLQSFLPNLLDQLFPQASPKTDTKNVTVTQHLVQAEAQAMPQQQVQLEAQEVPQQQVQVEARTVPEVAAELMERGESVYGQYSMHYGYGYPYMGGPVLTNQPLVTGPEQTNFYQYPGPQMFHPQAYYYPHNYQSQATPVPGTAEQNPTTSIQP
ncbi:hypothetical protein Ciccas_009569 [Cichlidogyrus casuarinus]|uniref:SEC7 domain-containing protein n=1 Tax=Cichlidogyrus casuarinus TaxID=1844966 RepID=A0ABD2PXC0_9PLAT